MVDLNEFYKEFSKSPERTRARIVKSVISELVRTINDVDSPFLLYAEGEDAAEVKQTVFKTLGWPHFNDGGIFDQAYNTAIKATKDMIAFIRG